MISWGPPTLRRAICFLKVDWLKCLLLFSPSVLPDSLQPHGLQHARLPCPSLPPGISSNSCPLSQWCYPTISSCADLSEKIPPQQHPDMFDQISAYHSLANLTHRINHHISQGFYGKETRREGEWPEPSVSVFDQENRSTLDKWKKHLEQNTVLVSTLWLGSCQQNCLTGYQTNIRAGIWQ